LKTLFLFRFKTHNITASIHKSHLNNAVNGPGIVACEAEDKKRAKYAILAPFFCFVPVAVETLGALGADAMKFFTN